MRIPSLGRLSLPATGLLVAVVAAGFLTAPASAEGEGPDLVAVSAPDETGTDAATEAATAALDEVRSILEEPTAATEDGRDLTMALRDLRLRQDDLSARQRATARRLAPPRPLPNSAPYKDFGSARIHWAADDTSATPEWVDQVGAVVTHVLATYKAAGYRAPMSDGTQGGSNALDVYLVDFGNAGLYGYCDAAADPPQRRPFNLPAYCAFDHDFRGFPQLSPLDNLKVTAAHELFHATQFAYDYADDRWFMEATATWAEDEVYDSINDNRQYLAASPLRQPRQPLDQFSNTSLRQYGEWIFFRYLTERFPKSQGGLPVIVRRIWERADSVKGAADNFSIQAVSRELRARGTDLRRFYAKFGDANRRPVRAYEEGRAYRPAPAVRSHSLTPQRRDSRWQRVRLDHLATATVAVRPGARMKGWRLRVAVDLPPKATSVAAIVTRYDNKGRPSSRQVRLSRAGNGKALLKFDGRTTSRVDVTLSNAGIHYRPCWVGPRSNGVSYSCSGVPRDDNRRMSYRVTAVR